MKVSLETESFIHRMKIWQFSLINLIKTKENKTFILHFAGAHTPMHTNTRTNTNLFTSQILKLIRYLYICSLPTFCLQFLLHHIANLSIQETTIPYNIYFFLFKNRFYPHPIDPGQDYHPYDRPSSPSLPLFLRCTTLFLSLQKGSDPQGTMTKYDETRCNNARRKSSY